MKSRFIRTKDFYNKTMMVALPIMIQNGITNFVNMLDNIMIGRIGTDQMTGVSVVNTLLFVWNLCIFGGLSGVGIFTAQFYGKGDQDGVRYSMRLQVWIALFLFLGGIAVFYGAGEPLIRMYLHEDGSIGSAEVTLSNARTYLTVMLASLLPFAFSQVYATTLRSAGETMLPMKSGLIAVVANLAGNYILIYGKLGFPALGVTGAAIATVIAKTVELLYIAVQTHRRPDRYPFIRDVYKSPRLPADLAVRSLVKATPLLLNEFLWSAGQAALMQNYSLRGLSVVAAFNIAQAVNNVFNMSFIAMGNATGIIIGQELGAGRLRQAREDANKLIVFSMMISTGVGAVLFAISGYFPLIYKTADDIRAIATGLIRISACCIPLHAFLNACYFILRSGGSTLMTFLFDACFVWVISVPLAFVLVRYTMLTILLIYLAVQLSEIIKCVIGFTMYRRGVWINNLATYRS